ncbi:glycosyltransferase [Gordonia sp. ABSL11-1]|uniref:glycosyltransferase n=1 Tax=Gordonia sp. ABSL11-1 TaxID=3053924 RepID=UPI002573EDF0|nr:glycosyltransferase [Gordonia sp. ABSL11-1]MDL9948867.1 glycosyltransferase [Gordonia sp. ABSL11-1]
MSQYRYNNSQVSPNTRPVDPFTWRLPNIFRPKKWWVTSSQSYPTVNPEVRAAVVWNPLYALSPSFRDLKDRHIPVVFDLLDDWTVHHHFIDIRDKLEDAYRLLLEEAKAVTANAEGTVELARRFGRSDVILLPNGCDPDRFNETSLAKGATTVGYVGKIGVRLNYQLIREVVTALPDVRFVFAGPLLDKSARTVLSSYANVEMLGDVHYREVPALLQQFDVGWVPHEVGEFEVGGDVIKTYEYRAAGLPVVSTPVTGAGARGLSSVVVAGDARTHVSAIRRLTCDDRRALRVNEEIPLHHTWKWKSEEILRLIDMDSVASLDNLDQEQGLP